MAEVSRPPMGSPALRRRAVALAVLAAAGCAEAPEDGGGSTPAAEVPDDGVSGEQTSGRVDDVTVRRTFYLPGSAGGGEAWAISVFYPDSAEVARWPEGSARPGAPVAVSVPGSLYLGDLCTPALPTWTGLVQVQFALPGGPDSDAASACASGFASSGEDDRRGEASARALRDVLLFALGRAPDARGRVLADIVETAPVHADNVGIAASSNGGNLAAVTLDLYGSDLAPSADRSGVRWVSFGESPLGSIFLGGELGTISDDDPGVDADGNGVAWDDMNNPHRAVVGCPDALCGLDYARVRWNSEAPPSGGDGTGSGVPGGLYWDGDGDGRFTEFHSGVEGELPSPDVDQDGVLEADEDFDLQGTLADIDGETRLYFSTAITAWAAANPDLVFGPGRPWPPTMATPDEAAQWWALRDGGARLASIASNWAEGGGLAVVVAGCRLDHVQATVDHPHLRWAYDELRRGGAWVRLNAGSDALDEAFSPWPEGIAPPSANAPGAPLPGCEAGEASADCQLTDWLVGDVDAVGPAEPYGRLGAVMAAGVVELVDRVHEDRWD